jgi:hypothetical protein
LSVVDVVPIMPESAAARKDEPYVVMVDSVPLAVVIDEARLLLEWETKSQEH